MDRYLQQEIKELLEHLDAREHTSASQSDENQQATEVIDVFVIHRQVEDGDPTAVESTLVETSDEQETRAAPSQQEATELPPDRSDSSAIIVVGYVRRSSEMQKDNYSIDAQKRAIREAAKLRGLPEPTFFAVRAKDASGHIR